MLDLKGFMRDCISISSKKIIEVEGTGHRKMIADIHFELPLTLPLEANETLDDVYRIFGEAITDKLVEFNE